MLDRNGRILCGDRRTGLALCPALLRAYIFSRFRGINIKNFRYSTGKTFWPSRHFTLRTFVLNFVSGFFEELMSEERVIWKDITGSAVLAVRNDWKSLKFMFPEICESEFEHKIFLPENLGILSNFVTWVDPLKNSARVFPNKISNFAGFFISTRHIT